MVPEIQMVMIVLLAVPCYRTTELNPTGQVADLNHEGWPNCG